MPLNEGDKALVREIAFEVAETIKTSIQQSVDTQIQLHRLQCPVAAEFKEEQNRRKGAMALLERFGAWIVALAGLLIAWQPWKK